MNTIGSIAGWMLMSALFAWARNSEARGGRPAVLLSGCVGAAVGFGVAWVLAVSFGQGLSAMANVFVLLIMLASVFFGIITFAKVATKLGWR